MKLRPLKTRLVIKDTWEDDKTSSGLYISWIKPETRIYEITQVWPDVVGLEVGNKVIKSGTAGEEIKIGKELFILVDSDYISAIVEY